jgi:P27 family predicted phage terminase small subunit
MTAGRPRKPSELKLIQGTFRSTRENIAEPIGTPGTPKPPDQLSTRAVEIYYEVCTDMDRLGILNMEWGPVIADYARAREDVEIYSGIIEDLGPTYESTNRSGECMFRARPETRLLNDAYNRVHRFRTELGLSPAAKGKVAAAPKIEDNPFKKIS